MVSQSILVRVLGLRSGLGVGLGLRSGLEVGLGLELGVSVRVRASGGESEYPRQVFLSFRLLFLPMKCDACVINAKSEERTQTV